VLTATDRIAATRAALLSELGGMPGLDGMHFFTRS
jgi:hypothetical protein